MTAAARRHGRRKGEARLAHFLRSERGAARTEAGFAVAAALGVGIVAVLALMAGPPDAAAPAPATPHVALVSDLMASPMRHFTAAQVRERVATYLDPAARTEAQLRRAHDIWTARVGDPRYADQDLAHDMALIVGQAMRARGVTADP